VEREAEGRRHQFVEQKEEEAQANSVLGFTWGCPESFLWRPFSSATAGGRVATSARSDCRKGLVLDNREVTKQLSALEPPAPTQCCGASDRSMPQKCLIAPRILPRNDIFLLESIRVPLPTSNLLTSYSH
jgi:hypothetical protein